jgi:hypothetical protein
MMRCIRPPAGNDAPLLLYENAFIQVTRPSKTPRWGAVTDVALVRSMKIPGLRASRELVGGIVFFGRTLDKIRLHAAFRVSLCSQRADGPRRRNRYRNQRRSSEFLLRLGIAGELVSATIVIFAMIAFYRLFKAVSQKHAMSMVILMLVSVPISYLFPFGIVIWRSSFIPRIIGVFAIIAGCGYVISSLAFLFLPTYAGGIDRYTTILEAGELPLLWMLIWGARDPRPTQMTVAPA